ncbi:MFS transporter small subunit [Polymorphobacter sp.]|uniref:MFS transporter small subunit n=1 Tax=Polymorphobacter sp. TaxID=1909290 RepID=UPI003F709835
MIVGSLRDAGTPRDLVYPPIYQALPGVLSIAFVANLLIRPVDKRFHSFEDTQATMPGATAAITSDTVSAPSGMTTMFIVVCWTAVLFPIAWGIIRTLEKVTVLLN